MKAKIRITLKNGVLDPQGKAIEGALGTLGCFVFYMSTSFASPVGAHTMVYAAGTIIITGMLVLMGLSGFKPNESVT